MPGVPPDALGKLKGMLKGMIKGGSKKKQSSQDQQRHSTVPSSAAPPPALSSNQPATMPVTPSNAPQTLPPTFASTTGDHAGTPHATSEGQAVGVGAAAGPGAAGLAASGGRKSAPPGLGDGAQDDHNQVSPSEPPSAAVDERDKSEPVSALEEDDRPMPPPKQDSVASPVASPLEKEQVVSAVPAPTSEPVHQTLTTQRLDPALAPTDDENAKPNDIAPVPRDAAPAALSEQPPQATSAKADVLDKSMRATAEPPLDVKPVPAAPGMSATSGPLQDFHEYGTEKESTT